MSDPEPKVVSVNVGAVREIVRDGRVIRTAIWKEPVGGRVRVSRGGLEGDAQADPMVHGGPDKAVYAYAVEDYRYWTEQGLPTHPGLFGENLTLQGVDLGAALPGVRWRIGTAVFEVTQPRLPCYKLGIRVGDPGFPKRFLAAARYGVYLRVAEPGQLGAGDSVQPLGFAAPDDLSSLGDDGVDRRRDVRPP